MHACEPYCSVRTSNGHYEQQLLAKMLIPFDLSRNPTFEDFVLFQNSIEKDDDDMSLPGITRNRTLKNVKRNKQLNSKDVFNTVQHTMSSRKAKSVLHIKKTVRIMRRPERVPSSTEDADSTTPTKITSRRTTISILQVTRRTTKAMKTYPSRSLERPYRISNKRNVSLLWR
jgi:hypothetical protein